MNPGGHRWNAIRGFLIAALGWWSLQASAGLLPFPFSANQLGRVHCLEKSLVGYDVYLPPAYSTNGPALPILYTFNPDGGGMVASFKPVCSNLNIICVGILGVNNSAISDIFMRECAAVTRDIRLRVLFDPTAEFASGFSGGGLASYVYSRFRAQHVSGAFLMSGWLGRGGGYPWYQTTDRVVTNLLVARAMGLSDGGSWVMESDSNYLACCGTVFRDEYFVGGHQVPADDVKSNGLAWLVSQRILAGTNDQADADVQGSNWRARIAAGEQETVLRECVAALMGHPRSWIALEAQLALDDLMADETTFRSLSVSNLASGDFASDLFYYQARGAGDLTGITPWFPDLLARARYRSALKALTGITGVNGDRAGDIRKLLLKYNYAPPVLQCSTDPALGQMNLWFSKDMPGLDSFLESRTDLGTGAWQQLNFPVLETNTAWSVKFDLPPGSEQGFYRLRTSPSAGVSPPWPGDW